MTPEETADYLSVSKRTLLDRYRRWGLPVVRVGRHLRFRERDVESWIDSQTVEP